MKTASARKLSSVFIFILSTAFFVGVSGCSTAPRKIHRDPSATRVFDRGPSFEEIYHYAVSPLSQDGMSLSPFDAHNFAERVLQKPDPDRYFNAHQLAFNYAYRPLNRNGMGLSPLEARDFADRVAIRSDGARYVRTHQDAYVFAYKAASDGGMDLNPIEARGFADRTADRRDGDDYLSCFRDRFSSAFSSGMNLSIQGDRQWADLRCDRELVPEPGAILRNSVFIPSAHG